MDVPYTITIQPSKTYTNGAPIPANANKRFAIHKKTDFLDSDFVNVGSVPIDGFNEATFDLALPAGLKSSVWAIQYVTDGLEEQRSASVGETVTPEGEPPAMPGIGSTPPIIISITPTPSTES